MFLAFLVLREKDKDKNRPYKVPGNNFIISLLAYIPTIILILSIFLTILPTSFNYQDLIEKVPIMLGTIIAIILGEILTIKVKD